MIALSCSSASPDKRARAAIMAMTATAMLGASPLNASQRLTGDWSFHSAQRISSILADWPEWWRMAAISAGGSVWKT
jgi:hypothetical protein